MILPFCQWISWLEVSSNVVCQRTGFPQEYSEKSCATSLSSIEKARKPSYICEVALARNASGLLAMRAGLPLACRAGFAGRDPRSPQQHCRSRSATDATQYQEEPAERRHVLLRTMLLAHLFILFYHVMRCDKNTCRHDRLAGVLYLIEAREICYIFFTLLLIGSKDATILYRAPELATLRGFLY